MAAVAMCFVQYEAILAMKMTKLNVYSVISLSKKRVFLLFLLLLRDRPNMVMEWIEVAKPLNEA